MFESAVSILCRDKDSILADLNSEKPPVEPDEDGVFYFDRDW
jgi:hypothetical protein